MIATVLQFYDITKHVSDVSIYCLIYRLHVSLHKTIKLGGGVFEGFDIVFEITCL